MVKLVFARHGQSEWNKANLFTGWAELTLQKKVLNKLLKQVN